MGSESNGRESFQEVFRELKKLLVPFEDRLLLKKDHEDEYSLDTPHSEAWGRELFFGAVKTGKSYVSFHLMPVYMFPDLLDDVPESLRKRMQGKSCFNFKRVDDELFGELAELTRRSYGRLEAENVIG